MIRSASSEFGDRRSDGRTDGQPCVKIVITTGRDCGSISEVLRNDIWVS